MGKRHQVIGIKQTINYDWMRKTTNLVLAGLDPENIRGELHDYLGGMNRKSTGEVRSKNTRSFIVNILMKIWVTPDRDLNLFRSSALNLIGRSAEKDLAVNWAMISASYPFWYNVARQTGRLFALQDQVCQAQVVKRLKEQYGDRDTIVRYASYVLRSFVDWGVLKDTPTRGCYIKSPPIVISDSNHAIMLVEAGLHALPGGKAALDVVLNSPALFPFSMPAVNGDAISSNTDRVSVERYGLDDELLRLKVEG
ncbi:hypothetical protein [Desulfonatronovibrio magnus]|uniref:hypothetical protein n=1 Tax=Desulfonatronovibrio magnus TaxID=698827 RepID=UPI0005EB0493|nr:hypothetical protein [Desulfonatronovibrio magnus]